ncbi:MULTISPECIES: type III secretion system export apparatus subunit SctT [Pantoea]|jgi:type III secretion protein T|uniref:type III secretion system export apparatus subunit SctT n=1 Tax=Pantoea TaxID=53335 RepID=UPI00034A0174|nr:MULTISPECIES: type III secretion system export apparatus subunit SctT [Pantoea]MCS4496712.1 type III secretion system export apparatus subunit SctT [Pantoea sp. B623]PQK79989.1 EscT/YscT/HrcT family type III secretion system export apparatus protein [Pantoea ananatis]REF10077.1 type III secretion protein T [Pantoea ananatis]
MWNSQLHEMFTFIISVGFGMARIYPCLLLSPVFSFGVIKGGLRGVIAIAVALFPAPAIQQSMLLNNPSWFFLGGLVIKELVIGLLIGLFLSMPFWLFQSVGALFDNQRGALMGGQLNPLLGEDETPLSFLMQQSVVFLLLSGLGLTVITQVLWDSYLLWQPLQWMPFPDYAGFRVYLEVLKEVFIDIVIYAGPIVVLLLMVDFALAILSIYSPQLQATLLAAPVKCLLGMFFLVLYIPSLNEIVSRHLYDFKDLVVILKNVFSKR